jgi:hypothetical protein
MAHAQPNAPPRPAAAAPAPPAHDAFLSFEWRRGLLPAQVLCAALANAPAPAPRVWFALEQDAALPAAMAAGVAGAGAFVLLATEGALTRPNVRHELACAVAGRRRLVILRERRGPPLEALLGELDVAGDAAGDAAAGRRHLDGAGVAAFKAAAREAVGIEFERSEEHTSELSHVSDSF